MALSQLIACEPERARRVGWVAFRARRPQTFVVSAVAVNPEARLEAWTRLNACLLVAGVAAATVAGRPWPLAVLAIASFGLLIALGSGVWTERGHFGGANAVTAVRLSLLVLCALSLHRAPGMLIAALLLGVFALDAVDGWLARHFRDESAFGAHFDMETDALLVLSIGLELWQRGALDAWILVPGLLRYVYVLFVALLPGEPAAMPRARWARNAFGLLVVGLLLALVLEDDLGALAALLGSVLVSASFVRSFHWSWVNAKRPHQPRGARSAP